MNLMDLSRDVERAERDRADLQRECLKVFGYEVSPTAPNKVWSNEMGRWLTAPDILGDMDVSVREVRRQFAKAHPIMTMTVNHRWSAAEAYVFVEITWPSREFQGRSRFACHAVIAALLKARAA